MRCSDLMVQHLVKVGPVDTVDLVAERMRDHHIGFVPVCDDAGCPLGTITDRDLTVRVIAEKKSPERTSAESVMSRDLITCRPDDPILIAERLMGLHKVSRILCTDIGGRLVGVVSLSDLAEHGDPTRAWRVLREVSHREAHVELR